MSNRGFYLAIQTLLPPDYATNAEFAEDLSLLSTWGFDGLELNIEDPSEVDANALKRFLSGFNLEMSMFASGKTAKAMGLSLASTDQYLRELSVEKCKVFLEFAAEFGAGMIAGYLKGKMPESTEAHRESLKRSIAEIAPYAERYQTPFLVEAINRFESPIGNTLDDTFELIRDSKNEFVWILPDTWHMHIEEKNADASLIRHNGHYGSFHLSDSNRYFPGYGSLDFKHTIGVLAALGYSGKLAIEGNVAGDFRASVNYSMSFLEPILVSVDVH